LVLVVVGFSIISVDVGSTSTIVEFVEEQATSKKTKNIFKFLTN